MGQDKNKKAPAGQRSSDNSGEDDRDMGSALRTVYQKTVDEEIPDEFLDLLGKLQ
ncbi:NepR family anti-sigma factor [Sphingomonas sp. KR1UV-12]|uniref:NepR family anti-sigma factor n=1 Tax=Sphingomonas aurea TaxID=3063994 RepID=A0ABT9EFN4_9SPHN|nr:NepR family anti-sigma factor [Sphingomonas sp. KR1UV-12]MDP1025655.1 NepR family anti-sigma factor [Sphingomonas sp. KR1UV-12]